MIRRLVLACRGQSLRNFSQSDDGAIPRTYLIAVESVEEVSMEDFNAGKQDKQLLPKKFGNAKSSGLVTTVPDQDELFVFNLELKD